MRTADFGPGTTPLLVKWFIIMACAISISSAFIQGVLAHLEIFPGSQEILSLSWWGISNGFLWQPFTYAFVQDLPMNDLTFSFFMELIFNIYVFWILGSALNNALGMRSFGLFLSVSAVLTGVITMTLLRLIGRYDMVTGLTAVVVIILTAWCIRFPNTPIFLFLLIPVNSITLAVTLVAMIVLYALFEGQMANVLLYLVAILVSYLYAITVWGWRTPFLWLTPVDNWILDMRAKFTHNHPTLIVGKDDGSTIIDIDTGRPTLGDDAFVDEMLEKIAKSGEESLTWREKQRLQKISERKKGL